MHMGTWVHLTHGKTKHRDPEEEAKKKNDANYIKWLNKRKERQRGEGEGGRCNI